MNVCEGCIRGFVAALFAGTLSCTFARDVPQDVAKMVALGWLAESCEAMELSDPDVETHMTEEGSNSYHVVSFPSGGYLILPTDDRIEPVLAYCETGEWQEPPPDSPLSALLSLDISNRMRAAPSDDHVDYDVPQPKRMEAGKSLAVTASIGSENNACVARWRSLEAKGRAVAMAKTARRQTLSSGGGSSSGSVSSGISSLSDVRRKAFVKSEWGQQTAAGGFLGLGTYNCFNLYTPSAYPCGCVATAMAQSMRYYKWPTSSVSKSQKICKVDGKKYYVKMLGGKYDWSNMPLSWRLYTTEAERKAMGRLTFDCSVSIETAYSSSGSSVPNLKMAAKALKSNFKYAHASCRKYNKSIVIANMDASSPVLLTMFKSAKKGVKYGHAVVVDGYGYDSGKTLYFHMNPGWNGQYMLWYNASPPVSMAGDAYVAFEQMVCNIFPRGAKGALLTGRVTDVKGSSSKNATVLLYDGNGKIISETSTDSSGIYSFRVNDKKTYSIRAHGNTLRSTKSSVAVSFAKGGVNMVLSSDIPKRTCTLNANGGLVRADNVYALAVLDEFAVGDLPVPVREGYTFAGWWTKKSGGTKVTAKTKVTKNVTYYAHWTAKKYAVTLLREGKGSVSGGGKKAYQSKVTVKAKPSKWYVFQGWYREGVRVSQKAAYSFKVPLSGVTYKAKFITKAEDKAAIGMEFGGVGFGALEDGGGQGLPALPVITNMCGIVTTWPIATTGATPVSVSVKGQPKGMAYSKATKAVTGVPSVANRSGTMTITVKSAGGSRSWTVKWRTVALDAFASGSFNGWTYVPSGEDAVRKVTVNVTAAGKITAKVGTLSLSRTGWTLGEDGFYRATLTKTRTVGKGKAAKKYRDTLTLVLDPDKGWTEDQLSGTVTTCLTTALDEPLNEDTAVSARRNPFGDNAEAKDFAAELAALGTQTMHDDNWLAWKVKVSAKGVATISRTTGTGKKKKTVSATAVVTVEEQDEGYMWGVVRCLVSGEIIEFDLYPY